jgi:hypothetical protein
MPCNRNQKISTTVFWRIRPKLAFQKSVKTLFRFRQLPSVAKAAFSAIAFGCKSRRYNLQSLVIGTWLLGVGPDRASIPRYLKAGLVRFVIGCGSAASGVTCYVRVIIPISYSYSTRYQCIVVGVDVPSPLSVLPRSRQYCTGTIVLSPSFITIT